MSKTTSEKRRQNKKEILSPTNLLSKEKMTLKNDISLRKRKRKIRPKLSKATTALIPDNISDLKRFEDNYFFNNTNEIKQLIYEDDLFLEQNNFLNINIFYGSYSEPEIRENVNYKEIHHELKIKDFEYIRLINKGAFGRVWLVRRKLTNDIYAMKIVNILDHIINKKDIKSLEAESKVFSIII